MRMTLVMSDITTVTCHKMEFAGTNFLFFGANRVDVWSELTIISFCSVLPLSIRPYRLVD